MFTLTVKTLDGRDSVFEIEDEEINVENFKKEVESRLGVHADRQRLIFQGKVLQDNQTLLEAGVQGKVVHLVARRPPTREQQPTVASESTPNEPALSGFGLGGIGVQQTIRDITSGLLNSMSELTRSAHIPLNVGSEPIAYSLSGRENTFNKLYRQASRLVQRIGQHSTPNGSGVSEDIDSPTSDESKSVSNSTTLPGYPLSPARSLLAPNENLNTPTNTTEAQIPVEDDNRQPKQDSSQLLDMVNEGIDEVKQSDEYVNDKDNEQTKCDKQTDAENISSEPSMATLASMLSRHRQLWHLAEPYLDQWEAMLVAENQIQSDAAKQSKVDVNTDSSLSSSNFQETEVGCSNVASTSVNFVDKNMKSDTASIWHQRLFSQVSRLLHLHAHMLHLISDFNVVTMRDADNLQNTDMPVSQTDQGDTMPTNPVKTSNNMDNTLVSEDVPMEDEPLHSRPIATVPSSLRTSTRRVLSVLDDERHWMRTRINTEPDVTIVATSADELPRVTRTETSTIRNSARNNRSRSASFLNRTNYVQTNGVDAPVTTAPSFPLTYGSTSGTGRPSVVHRMDYPVISMNVLDQTGVSFVSSLPTRPLLLPRITVPTSGSASTTVTNPPVWTPGVFNPANSNVASGTTTPRFFMHPPDAYWTDPFLHCHSRHFSSYGRYRLASAQGLSGSPPHTSSVPLVNSVPSTDRRSRSRTPIGSRSQEANQPDSSTNAQPTEPSVTSTISGSASEENRPHLTSFVFSPGLSLSQQLASVVSAATNAAVSAVNAGGLGTGRSPFSVLVSSSPIQFVMNTAHLQTTVSSQTATTNNSANHSVVSNTPSTRIDSSSVTEKQVSGTAVPLKKPDWAVLSGSSEEAQLIGIFKILTTFIEGLVKTVWSRISQLSQGFLPNCPGIEEVKMDNHISIPNQRVFVGLLIDVMKSISAELSAHSTDGCPLSDLPSVALDGMREHLQHLLTYAEGLTQNRQTELVNGIVSVIFQGIVSDEFDSGRFSWLKKLEEVASQQVVDVIASLVKLCKYIISSQVELWKASPTNIGFGTTFLMTLKIACTDLLCLTDTLTVQLASAMGLDLLSSNRFSESQQPRERIFGMNMNFEPLSNHIYSFLHDFGDDRYFDFCQAFVSGVDKCIHSYTSMDEAALRVKVAQQKSSFLTFRTQRMPSPMAVDTPHIQEQTGINYDDMSADEMPFMDACSELPMESNVQPAKNQHTDSPVPSFQNRGRAKMVSLPEWTPKPGELPEHWTQALAPNPACVSRINEVSSIDNSEGWHAVIPPAWVRVVASDLSTISDSCISSDTENSNDFSKFSDGYIAGMPAKRRKVMEEHTRSLFSSPESLFTECLTNAIGDDKNKTEVSENDIGSNRSQLKQTNSINKGSKHENNVFGVNSTIESEVDKDLLNALRNLVADRIATRLANDPDFDPTQFPLANQKFSKKDPKV